MSLERQLIQHFDPKKERISSETHEGNKNDDRKRQLMARERQFEINHMTKYFDNVFSFS